MKIKLSIVHKNKIQWIEREVPDIQIQEANYPMDFIKQNLTEVVSRMMEKLKEKK